MSDIQLTTAIESDPETEAGTASTPDESQTGESTLVDDLLSRQEEVLKQLDELNTKVESAIDAINRARQLQIQSELANFAADPEVNSKAA